MTDLARTVLARLTEHLPARADPQRAVAMAAYMRGRFPFLGLSSPLLRATTRTVLAGLPRPDEDDLRAVALGCWALPEREYQYVAAHYLRRHARVCDAHFIATAEHLIITKSWWDTVDELAAHLVGPLVRRHPALVDVMDDWIAGDQLWLIRTAIIHQLGAKEATDVDRLLRYCAARADHPDFFVRKAIGWALRNHARIDPEVVRAFVRSHQHELSGLSRREALKNIGW
jgi:3-methyladenine DNA glycosylase AlkD